MIVKNNSGKVVKHYGVPGMKWGVRKGNKNDLSKMSDEQLRSKINRMRMEQQYKQLSSKKKTRGSKIVKDALKHVGKRAVKRATNSKVDSIVDDMLNKM